MGLAVLIGACGAPEGERSESLDPGADVVDIETLTARHVEAMGGREALDSVRSLEIDMRIVEPAFTLDALYRVRRDGKMRIDVLSDGIRVFTEAYDGSRAWQAGADSTMVTVADEQATEAL